MMNNEFAKKVKGTDNAHIYLKMLREKIIEELGLNKELTPNDVLFDTLNDEKRYRRHYDLESTYNTQGFNNEHAIGYNNIEKRSAAENATQNF